MIEILANWGDTLAVLFVIGPTEGEVLAWFWVLWIINSVWDAVLSVRVQRLHQKVRG